MGWVLAVLLAQGLGQWHRVAHVGTGAPATARPAVSAAQAQTPALAQAPSEAPGHVHAPAHAHHPGGLFDPHSAPECRLYDQLACADGLPLAAAALWASPAPGVATAVVARPTAWLSPRYQRPARAPPQG